MEDRSNKIFQAVLSNGAVDCAVKPPMILSLKITEIPKFDHWNHGYQEVFRPRVVSPRVARPRVSRDASISPVLQLAVEQDFSKRSVLTNALHSYQASTKLSLHTCNSS